MEPLQNDVNVPINTYKPNEYEKERASNSYLMSVIAIAIGLPLPIINLIATAIFYFGNKKSTRYVRWHCTQALLSQLTIFIFNSIGYTWTLSVIFSEKTRATNEFFAYISILILFNIIEFIASIILAIKVRKGIHVEWWLWGAITNNIFGHSSGSFHKLLIRAALLILLTLGSWIALSQINWTSVIKINELTKKNKEKLGEIILDTQRTTNKEVKGFPLSSVNKIKNKICSANNIDTSTIKVYLFQSDEVNAYAIPGRSIIVNSSLITFCDNPDMLAGVLAHEIGHIESNHVSKKLAKEIGISSLLILAGGTDNMGTIKQVLKTLTSTSFDRDYEREADMKAVSYLQHAKIDPTQLAILFEKMADRYGDILKLTEWVNTHPAPEERADEIIKQAQYNNIQYTPSLSVQEWMTLRSEITDQ